MIPANQAKSETLQVMKNHQMNLLNFEEEFVPNVLKRTREAIQDQKYEAYIELPENYNKDFISEYFKNLGYRVKIYRNTVTWMWD